MGGTSGKDSQGDLRLRVIFPDLEGGGSSQVKSTRRNLAEERTELGDAGEKW